MQIKNLHKSLIRYRIGIESAPNDVEFFFPYITRHNSKTVKTAPLLLGPQLLLAHLNTYPLHSHGVSLKPESSAWERWPVSIYPSFKLSNARHPMIRAQRV